MSKMCHANRANKCRILKINTCQGKECPFIKTKIQLKNDIKKVYERIVSLDKSKQEHIANKYYHGRYPWLQEGDTFGC